MTYHRLVYAFPGLTGLSTRLLHVTQTSPGTPKSEYYDLNKGTMNGSGLTLSRLSREHLRELRAAIDSELEAS